MFERVLLALLIIGLAQGEPLMLGAKSDFIDTISKKDLAVFFYGTQDSPEYQEFEAMIPSDKQLFNNLQFYFIPSDKIKVSKQNNSLFIFRNIEGNEWTTYDGPFNTALISQWVRHNCIDSLPELPGQKIDQMLVEEKKGFILLDFGQFELLATKILLQDYCTKKGLMCGKTTIKNKALMIVVRLMRAEEEPGISKLAYWDPNTHKFSIFSKKPLHQITEEDLNEIVEGRQGLVKPDVTPTAPEDLEENTQDIEDKTEENVQNDEEL